MFKTENHFYFQFKKYTFFFNAKNSLLSRAVQGFQTVRRREGEWSEQSRRARETLLGAAEGPARNGVGGASASFSTGPAVGHWVCFACQSCFLITFPASFVTLSVGRRTDKGGWLALTAFRLTAPSVWRRPNATAPE